MGTLRVLALVACSAAVARAQLLEGSCANGLDVWDATAGTYGVNSICQHMPADELVNCDTVGGGQSQGSPLGARTEANNWTAAVAASSTNYAASYSCACRRAAAGNADNPEACPAGNANAGTVCQDATSHPSLYVDGYFGCVCMPGFSGPLCEIDFDECSSLPCQNGGACSQVTSDAVGGYYTCACEDGYTGDECQRDVDECSSQPCANSAACLDSNSDAMAAGAFRCVCTAGYAGATCTEDIPECDQDVCQQGARCFDSLTAPFGSAVAAGSYTCDCAAMDATCEPAAAVACAHADLGGDQDASAAECAGAAQPSACSYEPGRAADCVASNAATCAALAATACGTSAVCHMAGPQCVAMEEANCASAGGDQLLCELQPGCDYVAAVAESCTAAAAAACDTCQEGVGPEAQCAATETVCDPVGDGFILCGGEGCVPRQQCRADFSFAGCARRATCSDRTSADDNSADPVTDADCGPGFRASNPSTTTLCVGASCSPDTVWQDKAACCEESICTAGSAARTGYSVQFSGATVLSALGFVSCAETHTGVASVSCGSTGSFSFTGCLPRASCGDCGDPGDRCDFSSHFSLFLSFPVTSLDFRRFLGSVSA